MRKHHPDPYDHIPVSRNVLMRLGCAEMMGPLDNWEIVEEAVDEWMRKHRPEAAGEAEFAGYQWEGLFLPDGTVLRTVFAGKSHHCRVDQHQIMYEGKAVSPNGFVSAVGGVRRNAWKSIWLLLPDTKHWQRADAMRVRRQPVASRRLPVGARAATPALTNPRRAAEAAPPAPTDPITLPASAPPAAPIARTPTSVPLGVQTAARQYDPFAAPLAGHYRWVARPGIP
ncbi:MAG TPA: hypothetical protein VGC21_03555 [Telluria sp.]|jgi:hypothetical protein